jgi:dihydropteroate synthase
MLLRCGRFRLDLGRPQIMAIVNLTDDSFSGDGLHGGTRSAVEQGLRMIEEGADLLDIGGESSRPGAQPVSLQKELDRVLPVVEALRDCGRPLSVDTVKPEVMSAALAAGADMINDIAALRTPGAIEAVAATEAAVCLMHMQGEPGTMQAAPAYENVVDEVSNFLAQRVDACVAAGIARDRIVVDPGFGFGKALEHNVALLRSLPSLAESGVPILIGVSRKSMIGAITGRPVEQRAIGSAMAAALAVQRGARIVRVHDVGATRDALAMLAAID